MIPLEEYPFERNVVQEIIDGTKRKKKLIHIITGPRQVGKTTAALQIAARWEGQVVNASADQPLPPGSEWIRGHWEKAERLAKEINANTDCEVLLILDEIQTGAFKSSNPTKGEYQTDLVLHDNPNRS